MIRFFILVSYFIEVHSKVYFKEEFTDDDWTERWIASEHPSKDWGKFVWTPGRYYGDPEISKGIKTSEDNKFYALTTKFEPFSNKDKNLVIQFSVKHEQDIKCGGAYIKLFDCNVNPKKFHAYVPYLIMFGPDICGPDKNVHVIFNYNDRILRLKRKVQCRHDRLTHVYTLIIKPDNTYVVKIDNKIEQTGELEEDWDFLPPKKNLKPNIAKPADWNDDSEKPQKDHPEFLADSNAAENPNYVPDPYLYKFDEICAVGFDLWQVDSGTIFDNILITDDELEAEKHSNETWGFIKDKEKIMKIKADKFVGHHETSRLYNTKSITHDEF